MGKLTDRSELLAPVGDDLIHVIDVSDVSGGPAGTSKKMQLNKITTLEIVKVTSDDDLPPPVAGIITLEEKEYLQLVSYNSINSLAFPGTGKTAQWNAVNGAIRTYTPDTGAHFKDLSSGGEIEIIGLVEFHAPNGQMFDIISASSTALQSQVSGRFRNCKTLGRIEGIDFNVKFGSITGFYDGIRAVNCGFFELNEIFFQANTSAKIDYDGQTVNFTLNETITGGTSGATATVQWDYDNGADGTLVLSDVVGTFQNNEALTGSVTGVAVVNGVLQNVRFVDVSGSSTSGPVNMILLSTDPVENQALFFLDPDIQDSVGGVLIDRIQPFGPITGEIFDTGSLTQKDIKVRAIGSQVLADSTISANKTITNNASVTTISASTTPTQINAIWDAVSDDERMVCQDECTFDGSTDVITTAFNHGLSNDDVIEFVADGGLPTGIAEDTDHFIISVTATTFQVSLTSGGPAVDFTGNGTPPNYYRHTTGASASGWLIYIGEFEDKIIADGWVTLTKSGTTKTCRATVMKTDTSFVVTEAFKGSKVTVASSSVQSSSYVGAVELSNGEGIRVYIENDVDTDNLTATDLNLTVDRV